MHSWCALTELLTLLNIVMIEAVMTMNYISDIIYITCKTICNVFPRLLARDREKPDKFVNTSRRISVSCF